MPVPRPASLRYGSAILSVAAATGVRLLLDPYLGEFYPFALTYLALMFTAWYGGWGPSLAAYVFGLVTVNFFFIRPRHTFVLFNDEHLLGLLMYSVVGLGSILLCESLRAAWRSADKSARDARQKSDELEREVHTRIGLETELRERNRELAEAHRIKDEFLAMLAHELRNPLAPVRNGLEVFKQLSIEGTQLERVRAIMERQVQHLIRLVDDLLDLSRITHNKIPLHKQRVELHEVVADVVEMSRPLIDAHRHELHIALPEQPLRLEADPTRLEQILVNLIGNAAKYTDDAGRIDLSAALDGDELILSVRDNGIGIAPEMLPRIFEPFQRSSRATAHTPHEGLGIGLTLVRRLVELHGGSIAVHSEGVGKGSEFAIRLPLPAADNQSGRATPVELQTVVVPAKCKILVVDDNRDAARSLAMILRLRGHTVRVVHEARRVHEIAVAERPAVIFLDLGMPEMDGYEVARRLRADASLGLALLVALTGWDQEQDRARSRAAGFDLHLVKPIDVATIERLLFEREVGQASSLSPCIQNL